MTIETIRQAVDGLLMSGDPDTEIGGGFYAGDFLSRVMGKAPENCCWLTVMTNVNVAGVAVLAGIRAIVLVEGVEPSPELITRCRTENIGLMSTDWPMFKAAAALGRLEA